MKEEKQKRHCFSGEQQKMKGIISKLNILVKKY